MNLNSHFRTVSLAVVSVLLLAGCGKKPDACFTIEKGQPSSKLTDDVEVNAACTTDADSYVWEFGDGFSTTGAKAKQNTTRWPVHHQADRQKQRPRSLYHAQRNHRAVGTLRAEK